MPRPGHEDVRLIPPLLDRLLDDDPGVQVEADFRYGEDALIASVARDLTDLFNTRRSPPQLPLDCPEAEKSVLAYGLPDLTNLNPRSERDRVLLLQIMEDAVRAFEPRLTRVRLELAGEEPLSGHLRFRLDALLKLVPRPIEVTFDTVLQSASRSFVVREGD
jgi:type VI secretion system protein ImpF